MCQTCTGEVTANSFHGLAQPNKAIPGFTIDSQSKILDSKPPIETAMAMSYQTRDGSAGYSAN